MRRKFFIAAAIAWCGAATAGPNEQFCAGFAEGYKMIRGDGAIVPMCPMMPMIPMGSTPYREGVKAGMRAAGGG